MFWLFATVIRETNIQNTEGQSVHQSFSFHNLQYTHSHTPAIFFCIHCLWTDTANWIKAGKQFSTRISSILIFPNLEWMSLIFNCYSSSYKENCFSINLPQMYFVALAMNLFLYLICYVLPSTSI